MYEDVLNWLYEREEEKRDRDEGDLRPPLLPDREGKGRVAEKRGVPCGKELSLHLPHGHRPALRLPGAAVRRRPEGRRPAGVGRVGAVRPSAGSPKL